MNPTMSMQYPLMWAVFCVFISNIGHGHKRDMIAGAFGPELAHAIDLLVENGCLCISPVDNLPFVTDEGVRSFVGGVKRIVYLPVKDSMRSFRDLGFIPDSRDLLGRGIRTAGIERAHVPGRRI